MAEISPELMQGILKKIQEDVAYIRNRVDDHDEHFKAIRHMLAAMQSDDFRNESAISGMRADIDRIKRRLDLNDA